MTTSPPSQCPFHADQPRPPVRHAPGVWPPGPAVGLGWGALRRMSRDLLALVAEWQRDFGDVVYLRIWPEHQIVVTDPDLARELLVNHHDDLIRWERGMQVFGEVHGQSVLVVEGAAWKAKRHALQPGFSRHSVHAFVPTMVAAAGDAFARWPRHDDAWRIESAITSLAMDVIVRMMFSSEIGDDARMAEEATHTLIVAMYKGLYWPVGSPRWVPWKRAARKAQAVLDGLIDRHLQARLRMARDAWPDDLLSRLLTLHLHDPATWPLQAVHAECMTSFLAGHETSAATLTWWAWCMAANPAAQTHARDEVRRVLQGAAPDGDTVAALPYLTQTLQETLRLYPTAPVLSSRRSTNPLNVGPWQLPARTMFMVPVQLMHHDPRWFADPLTFRPERFGPDAPDYPRGAYMPFGAGPRVCLGQHLAMTEMSVIAAMLLQRFELSVPDGMSAPRPVLNVSLRPEVPLRLRVREVERD
ncbi:cytochrome P450 [Paraburkholderia sp. D15]|uniref:cytochrome P450 n=1 Tax=Paraburkholderia sp. D15 TaxID=2880218 RepID=UPI0024791E28|nr:cytochrome P450 [Paraburkholderia sp. D15]WGS53029.1 cytochrome P450 [Paraburkholderia sp. D15]